MTRRSSSAVAVVVALVIVSSASATRASGLRACGPSVCRSAASGELPKLPLTGKLQPRLSPPPADFYWVQASYPSGGKTSTHAYYYVPSENLLADNADYPDDTLEWYRVRGSAATALGDLTAALIPFEAQSRWPKEVPPTRPHTGGNSNPALPIVAVAVVLVALAVLTRRRLIAARQQDKPKTPQSGQP